jgi:hypothetical protein
MFNMWQPTDLQLPPNCHAYYLIALALDVKFPNIPHLNTMDSPPLNQQILCPNPYCGLKFPDNDRICAHLCDSSTNCPQWANNYINTLLQRQNNAEYEELSEGGDYGMYFI